MTDYTLIEEGNRHEMATDPAYAEAPVTACAICEEDCTLFDAPLLSPPDWKNVRSDHYGNYCWKVPGSAYPGEEIFELFETENGDMLRHWETPDGKICASCFADHLPENWYAYVCNTPIVNSARTEAPTRSATTPMITLALVADNRLTTAPTRPMPITGHNIDFARQELAELLDAHETRPVGKYERNTDKDHSARRELAQTIHQIGSALLTIGDDTPPAQVDPWIDMQIQIDFLLASARSEWNKGRKAQTVELLDLALVRSCDLAELMGLDPVAIVVEENARVVAKEEAKHPRIKLVETDGLIAQALVVLEGQL